MRAFQQLYSHPVGENSHYISARNRFCVFFSLPQELSVFVVKNLENPDKPKEGTQNPL